MGAWGHTAFANDSALDWLGDLTDGDPSLVGAALDAAGDADAATYIEVDEASAALAAGELVSAALGKGEERLNPDAADWLAVEEHRAGAKAVGAARARRAVLRVFENSELRELWDENGEDTDWHRDVRELLERLA